jgi:hypothetical protein
MTIHICWWAALEGPGLPTPDGNYICVFRRHAEDWDSFVKEYPPAADVPPEEVEEVLHYYRTGEDPCDRAR